MDAHNITTQAKELETSVNEAGLMDSRSIEFFKLLVKHGITTLELFKKHYVGQFEERDAWEWVYYLGEGNWVFVDVGYGLRDWEWWFDNPNIKPLYEGFRKVKS